MDLPLISWVFIIGFLVLSLLIGVLVSKRASSSSLEFFLSGRNMPWWLLGTSMVATTFSTSVPNLVSDIVRNYGVSGNWLWWAFLLTGMMTVFIYAKLWRRSGVTTDVEFYELRYGGKPAAFLRGFRALYLGVIFNVLVMAEVTLAAIKIGAVIFNFSPIKTVMIASVITGIYCTLGGLRGVLITDFIQFGIAMFGSVATAVFILKLPQVGGLRGLLSNELVAGKLSLLPDFSDSATLVTVFIIPLSVQWWSVWYPGAEPGGGGYIAQRMLAAKNERHAIGATFLFNLAHYALRPWPWIIVGLASIIVFPTLDSLHEAFPNIAAGKLGHDLAYPAMLTFLPAGLLGLVVASLIAAFMSTISTHLNWGSSYIVNDFFKRFIAPRASEKKLVFVGRLSTLFLMVLAAIVALWLQNSLQSFNILLQIGAGTGLLFILRWFWWRINAASEIAAMTISFLIAVYFNFIHTRLGFARLVAWQELIIGVSVTTACWITVMFLTKPTDKKTLFKFYRLLHPGGLGWTKVIREMEEENDTTKTISCGSNLAVGILCVFLGCLSVYGLLFATGYWIYSNYVPAVALTAVTIITTVLLIVLWSKLETE